MRDNPSGESLNKLNEWKNVRNTVTKQRKIIHHNIIRQKRIHSSKQSVAPDKVIKQSYKVIN